MKKTVTHVMSVAILCVFSAAAIAQEEDAAKPATAPVTKTGGGSAGYSMLQIHAFPNFDPYDKDIFKLFFDRIDDYQYGDDYFFLSVNSDYSEDWSANTETLYFKYAGNLSYKKVAGKSRWKPLMPGVRDVLMSVQVNSGDLEFLRTVWLGGAAIDIAGLPNYGVLRIYALVRQEDTQDLTHQVTVMWVQPFSTGGLNWVFNGWGAHWSNDTSHDVVKIEPQLRLRLSSFVGKKNIFYNAMIGTELEIGYHYLTDPETYELLDWKTNPSIFFAMPF